MNKSTWIAIGLVIGLTAWMASGLLGAGKPEVPSDPAENAAPDVPDVQVRKVAGKHVMRHVILQGQATAQRTITVRAETSGRVEALPQEKGARVEKAEVIAELAMNERQARRDEARALVAQRESEFNAAQRLGQQGYQAKNRVKEARAQLAAARTRLAAIQDEIENTNIDAPFTGVLNARSVEIGDYVTANGEIATLVDDNPLKIVGHVPQQKVRTVETGAVAEVKFVTGETVDGVVSFLSASAEEATRTYRVEIEVPNPDGHFRPGMSAEVRIPIGAVRAHHVSPAIFSLDTEGRLGIKTVGANNRVAFHPVDVVRAEADGAWVAGLPADATVITVGQGFVREGDAVRPVPADGATPPADEADKNPSVTKNDAHKAG